MKIEIEKHELAVVINALIFAQRENPLGILAQSLINRLNLMLKNEEQRNEQNDNKPVAN